jgi:hypothetical protein
MNGDEDIMDVTISLKDLVALTQGRENAEAKVRELTKELTDEKFMADTTIKTLGDNIKSLAADYAKLSTTYHQTKVEATTMAIAIAKSAKLNDDVAKDLKSTTEIALKYLP